MAQMIPVLTEEQIERHRPAIEGEVYRALRDRTPNEWLIFFSMRLVKQPAARAPEHGELDFVVFCPEFGLLVVEVKGGLVEVDPAANRWISTDDRGRRHELSDPLGQVLSGLKELTSTIRRECGWTASDPRYLLTGTALLFPDQQDVAPLAGPALPLATLGGADVLADPARWIRGIFDFWGKDNTEWRPLGAEGMAVANRLFARHVIVARPLAQVLSAEHDRQIELTQQQAQVLRVLRYRTRACISGAAGTGKTLLALQQARYYAGQGRRTLFVCYNRALSDFLARECHGVDNLDALTFEMLCRRRLGAVKKDHGFDLLARVRGERGLHEPDEVVLPYALARAAEEHPFRYQAMVVDEGQDFGKPEFVALRLLLEHRKQTPWFVFYDPNQAIRRQRWALPIAGPQFPLTQNCRNTHHIHAAAYAFFRGDDPADPPDISGAPVEVLSAPDLASQAALVRAKVGDLLVAQRLNPADVAVLVVGEPKKAFFEALNRSGEPEGGSWSYEQHWKKGAVVVDTVRRFKGLEAVVIILWGVEHVPSDVARELLYVSLSRARSRVWLVGESARVRSTLHACAVDTNGLRTLR